MESPKTSGWGDFKSPDAIIVVGLPILLLALAICDVPDEPALILCGFRRLTGLPCPGCGMTRGLAALLKGQVLQSVHFNALAIPALLFMVMVWCRSVCLLTNRGRTAARLSALVSFWHHAPVGWGILIVVVVYWVSRLLGLIH